MPVELRAARLLRVVAMPHRDVSQSHRLVQVPHRCFVTFRADDVVSRHVRVARIDARCHRNDSVEVVQQLRYLLERTAERELRACRVLEQHCESTLRQVQTLARRRDGRSHALQSFFPAAAAERSRMQHQELRAQRQRPLDLAAERHHRLHVKLGVRPRQVDEVIRMDHQRLEPILLAQATHRLALRWRQPARPPLPRTRREHLQRVASQPVRALRRGLDSAGRRGVYPDTACSMPRRHLRRAWRHMRPQEVLFLGQTSLGYAAGHG